MSDPKKQLIVAIDVPSRLEAAEVFKKLKGHVELIKIGLELYTREGREIVERAAGEGFKVFLDLKFHDIPNTVAKAVEQAARLNIFMINLHALGGVEMMRKAKESLLKTTDPLKRPLLIGVTVLTSHDEKTFSKDLAVSGTIADSVLRLAGLVKEAGLDGVVASPLEIKIIKSKFGKDFKVVTPGVRPAWASAGDQKRVMTPGEAIREGADFIVVGRPILEAKDSAEAVQKIYEEMK